MTTQSSPAKPRTDVYTIINQRIIEQLEKGTVPWRQPWRSAGPPRNLVTGRVYRGINVLLLSMLGYKFNLFLTLKQINDLGGKIRAGEHACPVVFWSEKTAAKINESENKENEGEQKETKKVLRYYSVFNVEQCIGLPEDKIPVFEALGGNTIKACEDVLTGMPKAPKIIHRGQEAYYNPLKDYIGMPKSSTFLDDEAYYLTLFHELIHSTGHESRLKREAVMNPEKFGSDSYSEEELVAQVGACFLSAHTGCSMKHFENDVAYIKGWLDKLKSDKRILLFASSKAQKAVDYILGEGFTPEEIEKK